MGRRTTSSRASREVNAHTWELRGHDLRWSYADAVGMLVSLTVAVAVPMLGLLAFWLATGRLDGIGRRLTLASVIVGSWLGALAGRGLVPRRWSAHRVELRREGLAFGRPGHLRFVPFSAIAGAERDGADVTFVAGKSQRYRLVPAYVRRDDPGVRLTFAEREAVALEILKAIRRGPVPAPARAVPAPVAAASAPPAPSAPLRPADLDATLALLARRGRTFAEWHAELRSFSAADARYRVVSLRKDTLVRIAEDVAVDEDAREAAALILAARRGA